MRDRREFTITRLTRDAGYWTARVTIEGVGFDVHRMHGSWQVEAGARRRDVRPDVCFALQAKVRPLERRAAREMAA